MNYRLLRMIPNLPLRDGLFIDCYNQSTSNIVGTITAGIYKRNLHFVMTKEPTIEPINTTPDGLATTLTTAHHYSGNIINPQRGQKEMGVLEIINTDINGNSRTITTQYGKKGWDSILNSDRDKLTCVCDTYRIRKLTPRECFRLMGVSETEIDTIQAANLSDTRQYFLAGNSIVVDVLEGIFRKMFIDKEITDLKLF